MGQVGFEPTTNTLKGYCSTVELLSLKTSSLNITRIL